MSPPITSPGEWHPELLDQLERNYYGMLESGELRSQEALDGYYATFRARFGPDVLRAHDGEALLSLLHETKRDGMIYWLEFKDDEEFPAIFGSIAGGSALKYGFYRRQGTGEWVTGSSAAQRALTTAEAIALARRDRDQLVAASDAVASMPEQADERAYLGLQETLARVAPDVQDTSWGHKYLSLLHPKTLDDFHALAYQRFHLIKLLQAPSTAEGRYVNASRFVALARSVRWPLHQLTSVLNMLHGPPHRYWRVGSRAGDEGASYWDRMRRESIIAIGWAKLADLTSALEADDFKEAVRERMASNYPADPRQIGRSTQQVVHFCRTMQTGDYVLVADGALTLGVARVAGSYRYNPSEPFPHERSVTWRNVGDWRLPAPEGLRTTVFEYRKDPDNLIAIERRLWDEPDYAPPPTQPDPPDVTTARRQMIWSGGGIIGRLQELLNRKGQAILYGPPGTGKTYWAEQAATTLAALWNFGAGVEQLSAEQRARVDGLAADAYVRACTFHAGYGYEDFIEGYRPSVAGGALHFDLQDGILKAMCSRAANDPDGRYYLIIDEINRGDIPRIFGELLTLLDAPKRGASVILPLSRRPFAVPNNLFIIGTMNTADRSIALLDAALRRRFGFIELMPDPATLGDTVIEGVALKPWLAALNQQITEHVGRDGRNLQIGHSYFMSGGRPIHDFKQLMRVLHEDVLPLLQEYCYEDWSTLARILGPGLVDESRCRFKTELFEPHRQIELLQAVLALAPDVSASITAVAADVAADVATDADDTEPVADAATEDR